MRTARRPSSRAGHKTNITRCNEFQATGIRRLNDDNFCDYKAGQTCVAKLLLEAVVFEPEESNVITYSWSTLDGIIHDSHTNETVVIWVTSSEANKEIEVTLTTNNGSKSSTFVKTFKTHHRLIL